MLCPACRTEGMRCKSVRIGYSKLALSISDAALERFKTPKSFVAWLDLKTGKKLSVADALAALPLKDWPENEDVAEDPGGDDDFHCLECPSCGARFEVDETTIEIHGVDAAEWTISRIMKKRKGR